MRGATSTPSSSAGRQHVLAGSAAAGSRQGLHGTSSIANSSMSSLGSGIVGAGATAQRYASIPSRSYNYTLNLVWFRRTSSTRYASPSTGAQPGSRRGSNASATSIYSAETLDSAARPGSTSSRRLVGSSLLRGSSSAPKRYSTPTPQSNQHHDFDSMASAGSAGSGAQRTRTGTPSRATWKF